MWGKILVAVAALLHWQRFIGGVTFAAFQGFVAPALAQEKLDLGAKEQYGKEDFVELIVKTSVPIKNKQKKMFKKAGFLFRSIIPAGRGAIVTGKIRGSGLKNLERLDFVEAIEGAKRLTPKR